MDDRHSTKPDITKHVLSLKGIISTFLFLFFCFYVIYRNTLTAVEVLEKSAFATGAILLVSVLVGFADKALKSRRRATPRLDAGSLEELSDEEYDALRSAAMTKSNAIRAAIYFYGLSLTVSIAGLYDAGIVKIILVSFLCFGVFALLFFSRLLYIRIRYGTWTAPRRKQGKRK